MTRYYKFASYEFGILWVYLNVYTKDSLQAYTLKTSSKLYSRAYPNIQKLLGARFKLHHEDQFKGYLVKSCLNPKFDQLEFVEKFKAKGTCLDNIKFH